MRILIPISLVLCGCNSGYRRVLSGYGFPDEPESCPNAPNCCESPQSIWVDSEAELEQVFYDVLGDTPRGINVDFDDRALLVAYTELCDSEMSVRLERVGYDGVSTTATLVLTEASDSPFETSNRPYTIGSTPLAWKDSAVDIEVDRR